MLAGTMTADDIKLERQLRPLAEEYGNNLDRHIFDHESELYEHYEFAKDIINYDAVEITKHIKSRWHVGCYYIGLLSDRMSSCS